MVVARLGELGEEAGVRAAEPEHRLVRVARDDGEVGTVAEQTDQFRGLRIEVLRVVDQQAPDPGPLTVRRGVARLPDQGCVEFDQRSIETAGAGRKRGATAVLLGGPRFVPAPCLIEERTHLARRVRGDASLQLIELVANIGERAGQAADLVEDIAPID